MAKLIAARRIFYCDKCMPVNDVFSVVNRVFCGWVVRDRFNILNKHLPFHMADIADEIPVADGSLEMRDICDSRAQEILALNQPIIISWSGGVDSTAILIALLRNGIKKDQLTILHAPSSINEYPWLYKKLTEEGYKFVQREDLASAFNDVTEGLLITGWCADQLFGSNIHLRNLSLYNLPWMDGLRQAIKDRGIRISEKSHEYLEYAWSDYAKQLGFEMTDFCEFAWIYNFGCKWSYVSQDAFLASNLANTRKRIINFFEDIRFQRWAVNNYPNIKEINVNRNSKFYKQSLKRYIHEWTNDPDYLLRKGKVNSWAQVKDEVDWNKISTLDTDGYHVFKFKGNPANPDITALRKLVANRYLKEEF